MFLYYNLEFAIGFKIFSSNAQTRRHGNYLRNIYIFYSYIQNLYVSCVSQACACIYSEKMTSYFIYHICNSISYFSLHIPYFTLHTSYFTLHYSHSTLPIALRTAFFTPHTSHCTLPTPYFILFELFSPYPSSFLLISFLLICYLNFHELFLNIATKEFVCTVRQPGLCVRALYETIAIMLSKKMTRS